MGRGPLGQRRDSIQAVSSSCLQATPAGSRLNSYGFALALRSARSRVRPDGAPFAQPLRRVRIMRRQIDGRALRAECADARERRRRHGAHET